jgi:hypothetical protein
VANIWLEFYQGIVVTDKQNIHESIQLPYTTKTEILRDNQYQTAADKSGNLAGKN